MGCHWGCTCSAPPRARRCCWDWPFSSRKLSRGPTAGPRCEVGDGVSDPPHSRPLRETDVDPDPVRQFAAWFDDAARAAVRAPEAVAVATASPEGTPSVRMVLLKGFDERGFVFFTNYDSRKGAELTANPHAALLFHWDLLGRQVRIEGGVS